MGLFRKKSDPISERAKSLNDRIAAIEAEIQRLSDQPEKSEKPGKRPAKEHSNGSPFVPACAPSTGSGQAPSGTAAPAPRLRSTALPHHHAPPVPVIPSTPAAPQAQLQPLFEEVVPGRDPARLDAEAPAPPPPDLGMRRHDAASVWERVKNQFRGPVTSNPKLVHYLSAGSIQGLRPLRYEKRVARNRVIVLAAFLVLALWGVIAIFISRH